MMYESISQIGNPVGSLFCFVLFADCFVFFIVFIALFMHVCLDDSYTRGHLINAYIITVQRYRKSNKNQ